MGTDTDHAGAESCEAMSALHEKHALLKPFEGTFKAEVTMWMGPGEPMKSSGTMVNELDLGGRFLKHTYTGDPSDGPFGSFEGRGYWGYNTVDHRFEGFWCDNACTFMMNEAGDVDAEGKVWTMLSTMTNPETGQPQRRRSIVTLVDENTHEMEMAFEQDGQWQCCMHLRYTRA